VLEVEDDMAYGREQLIYSLTPAGEALGLTVADLGRQLRTAFDGHLVQIFQDGPDEVEVRVRLPEAERNRLSSLYRLNVRTPDGRSVPLTAVAEWRSRRGFEVLRHADGRLAVEVTADVDTTANNANLIIAAWRRGRWRSCGATTASTIPSRAAPPISAKPCRTCARG
jgi:multidrug efflux pump subunit AcrB